MPMITEAQLGLAAPSGQKAGRIKKFYVPLTNAMQKHNIVSLNAQQMFLANILEETGELMVTEENLNYNAEGLMKYFGSMFPGGYAEAEALAKQGPRAIANVIYNDANRPAGYKLGNTSPGDGWKYRARGFMQTTGKGNYQRFFTRMGMDPDSDPDLLLKPEFLAESAAFFWEDAGCNALAEAGDFTAVVKRVNGGTINMDKREMYLARIRTAMKESAPAATEVLSNPAITPQPAPTPPRLLMLGMTGDDVSQLQLALNARRSDDKDITVDGEFGEETADMVKTLQAEHGLTIDGIVGPKTRAMLGIVAKPAVMSDPTTAPANPDQPASKPLTKSKTLGGLGSATLLTIASQANTVMDNVDKATAQINHAKQSGKGLIEALGIGAVSMTWESWVAMLLVLVLGYATWRYGRKVYQGIIRVT